MIPGQEAYNETEPFSRGATFEVASATFTQGYRPGAVGIGNSTVTVRNTDSYGGIFSVKNLTVNVIISSPNGILVAAISPSLCVI